MILRPEIHAAFTKEIARINLWRIIWISVVILIVDVAIIIAGDQTQPKIFVLDRIVHDLDITLCVAFGLISLVLLRWNREAVRLRTIFILIFLCIQVVVGDIYFFNLLPKIGPTTVYVVTVVLLGVLLLIPPWLFLMVLLANHAFYIGWLLTFVLPPPQRVAIMIDGSFGVTISVVAQFLLFTAKRRDFTQQRQLEERTDQLSRANAALGRRNEEMEEILAIASHDIRSPLQSLKNLLDVVKGRPAWNTPLHSPVVDEALSICQGILGMVTRLLRVYPMAAPTDHIREAVDLGRVVTDSVGRIRPQAEARQITVETEFSPENGSLVTNAHRLGDALDNLLSNAVKYSQPGAKVRVELRRENGGWSIDVCDEGPGVPEARRSSLFQKFQRDLHGVGAGSESTGLGLFIARKNLEAIGAEITFRSRQPHGSIFRIRLPDADAEGSTA